MTEQVQKQNKLVAIYGRVSSSNQENEGTIETQLSAINEFVKKNGYIVVNKYLDEGWSGDNIVRPKLDQLRVDAKKKLFEAVVMYDPDRLARRYSYQELIMDELREAGIEVIFLTVNAPQNSEDKILYGVRGLFAEYERAKITERFRLGKVRKANEGHVITSEAPYGYTFIPKKGKRGDVGFQQGYYEINEYESKIVKKIFSWVADNGMTLRAVVRKLQELNIKPRWSERGVWNTSTLSTMLRNKTYIGEGHYGSSYAVVPQNPIKKETYKKIKKTSRRMKPESEWIIIPTPKLIERDLFERVGQRLKSNFEMCVRNKKNEYLLAGKIWCDCGNRQTGQGALRGKHLYYRCNNRVINFPLPRTCFETGINAKIVDSLVWQRIYKLMSSPDLLIQQIDRWVKNRSKSVPSSTIDVEVAKREITKLREQEERYAKAYGAGVFSIEELKEYSAPLKEKISLFESQIQKAEIEKDQVSKTSIPNRNQVETFTTIAIRALKNLNFNAKKAIVNAVIEKVVGNKKVLQVWGYIPITTENHVVFLTKDRYCRAA